MKSKFLISYLILVILSTNLLSQTETDSLQITKFVPRFHLLPFGFSFEQHLKNHATIKFDIGVGLSGNSNPYLYNGIRSVFNVEALPYASIEPRIYTNLQSRSNKGKYTNYYSGTYGSFLLLGAFELTAQKDWFIQFGPLIGFQRSFESRLYWNVAAGVGTTIVEEDISFGLMADFSLGLVLQ